MTIHDDLDRAMRLSVQHFVTKVYDTDAGE